MRNLKSLSTTLAIAAASLALLNANAYAQNTLQITLAHNTQTEQQTKDQLERLLRTVGSHARGAARTDSDVDLIVLTSEGDYYLDDVSWLHTFGGVVKIEREHDDPVQSLRVHYVEGLDMSRVVRSEEHLEHERGLLKSWSVQDVGQPKTTQHSP
jgi:predicted nucleotidyltransferase